MCGLVGIAGEINNRTKDVFTTMYMLNAMRGAHGCGSLTLWKDIKDKQYYYRVTKSPKPSSGFVFADKYKTHVVDEFNTKILMGHSRHATIGEIKVSNNHPFEADGIIGMHNGTIRGTFDDRYKFDTDSEALFNLIAKRGLKKALEHVHEECYTPAYALAFYTRSENSVSLIRNDKRPLFLAKIDEAYIWSSDKTFIEFALAREGIKDAKIFGIEPGTLVKIFPTKNSPKERLKILPNYLVPPSFRGYPRYSTYGQGSGDYNRNQAGFFTGSYGGAGNKNDPEEIREKREEENKSYKKFFELKKDEEIVSYKIGHRIMPLNEFYKKLQGGCACCSSTPGEDTEVRFNGHNDEFFCYPCSETIEMFGYNWDELERVIPIIQPVGTQVH